MFLVQLEVGGVVNGGGFALCFSVWMGVVLNKSCLPYLYVKKVLKSDMVCHFMHVA